MPPTWTDAERRLLDELSRSLLDAGWGRGRATPLTVEHLLKSWRQLGDDVSTYELIIDDFTNDLTSRDGLEKVMADCSSTTFRNKLRGIIDLADTRYREATREDGGTALSRHFQVDEKSGWWWRRCPRSGPLAQFLGLLPPR